MVESDCYKALAYHTDVYSTTSPTPALLIPKLLTFWERQSPLTRRWYHSFGCVTAAYLTERFSHDVIVATLIHPQTQDLVAVAEAIPLPEPTTAELCVAVDETCRRQGLATRVLTALGTACRQHNITKLTATIDGANEPVLALARSLGFHTHYQRDSRLYIVTIDLDEAKSPVHAF